MPGRRGSERRRIADQVLVRLPPATAIRLRAEAASAGLTAAAWTRGRLVDLLGTDPVEAVPVPARRPPRPRPTVDVVALARLRESVGEAVGTLRQVAGLDRARGGTRLSELDAGIDRLLATAAELDSVKAAVLHQGPPL